MNAKSVPLDLCHYLLSTTGYFIILILWFWWYNGKSNLITRVKLLNEQMRTKLMRPNRRNADRQSLKMDKERASLYRAIGTKDQKLVGVSGYLGRIMNLVGFYSLLTPAWRDRNDDKHRKPAETQKYRKRCETQLRWLCSCNWWRLNIWHCGLAEWIMTHRNFCVCW